MSRKRSKTLLETVKQEVGAAIEDNRTTSLFPKVFECLAKFNEQNSQYFNVDMDNHRVASVEDKVGKFPLGLRMVCSDWNNSVENYYKTTHYPLVNKSRCIRIQGEDINVVDSHINFLSKFGRSVESITIEVLYFCDNTMVRLYLIIQQLVNNLRLLKRLSIKYQTHTQHYFEQLEETISLNPLPTFKKLESLNVTGRISNQIVNELLRNSNNLKSFKQMSSGWHFVGFNYSANFSKLTELDITIETNVDFQKLKKFGKLWNLKKFRGDFSGLLNKENWVDIFQVLAGNWSDSLESLGIVLPNMRHRNGYIREMLKYTLHEQLTIVTLKKIMIWTTTPISLDFLVTTRLYLESIYIEWIGPPKELDEPTETYYEAMDQQYIEHLGSESEMDKSNIWRSFVKLAVVKSVGDVVYRPAKYGLPSIM